MARKKLLCGQRVEMGGLADELGVGRVTLYRWVGSRELLLTEILWALAVTTMQTAASNSSLRGGARVAMICAHFTEKTTSHPGWQAFLAREGEAAMRLVTGSAGGGFQNRLIAKVQGYIDVEMAAGHLQSPLNSHELAYAVVRLCESFAYRPFITGEPPETAHVEVLLGLLLR